MKIKADSPAEYRKGVPEHQKKLLESIRTIILDLAPKADEQLGHGMLDYPGIANLGAQKNHVSLYVLPAVLGKHKNNFPKNACGKSCLRLKDMKQFDEDSIRDLLRDVIAARGKS